MRIMVDCRRSIIRLRKAWRWEYIIVPIEAAATNMSGPVG